MQAQKLVTKMAGYLVVKIVNVSVMLLDVWNSLTGVNVINLSFSSSLPVNKLNSLAPQVNAKWSKICN